SIASAVLPEAVGPIKKIALGRLAKLTSFKLQGVNRRKKINKLKQATRRRNYPQRTKPHNNRQQRYGMRQRPLRKYALRKTRYPLS
ncbi:hypothetical protein AGR55_24170, partial [Salmonella enterica subsp. enterica serovar Typhimurium]